MEDCGEGRNSVLPSVIQIILFVVASQYKYQVNFVGIFYFNTLQVRFRWKWK